MDSEARREHRHTRMPVNSLVLNSEVLLVKVEQDLVLGGAPIQRAVLRAHALQVLRDTTRRARAKGRKQNARTTQRNATECAQPACTYAQLLTLYRALPCSVLPVYLFLIYFFIAF